MKRKKKKKIKGKGKREREYFPKALISSHLSTAHLQQSCPALKPGLNKSHQGRPSNLVWLQTSAADCCFSKKHCYVKFYLSCTLNLSCLKEGTLRVWSQHCFKALQRIFRQVAFFSATFLHCRGSYHSAVNTWAFLLLSHTVHLIRGTTESSPARCIQRELSFCKAFSLRCLHIK